MSIISIFLVILGAIMQAGSMIWYYRLLIHMKAQTYEEKTFHHWIYSASFAMMVFFFMGYVYISVMLITDIYVYDFFPISLIMFFGAIFVLCMVGVQQKMTRTITRKTLETIRSMVGSIEAKDEYTKGHSEHVLNLAELIYCYLPYDIKNKINLTYLKDAAMLHDIGKIGIPDSILNKPGKLTDDEYEIIKQHPQRGKVILENTSYREISDMVLYHHERVDGKGYYGIQGENIPIESKMIAIADTFSALYTNRSYRKKIPFDKAIFIVKEAAGTQLDSVLVDVFCNIDRDEIERTGIIT